jgi:hypothetical protein
VSLPSLLKPARKTAALTHGRHAWAKSRPSALELEVFRISLSTDAGHAARRETVLDRR